MLPSTQCVIPENIYASPMEGEGKFLALQSPPTSQEILIPSVGGEGTSMDIFWNCTI